MLFSKIITLLSVSSLALSLPLTETLSVDRSADSSIRSLSIDRKTTSTVLEGTIDARHPKTGQQAIVISGFPGIGKTSAGKLKDLTVPHSNPPETYRMIDFDSTPYSKIDGKQNPAFPQNYVDALKEKAFGEKSRDEILFVANHLDMRKRLTEAGIKFTCVCPELSLKSEYLARYKERGSPPAFVKLLDEKWSEWAGNCASEMTGGTEPILLHKGQYLAHVMPNIIKAWPVQK